MPTVPGLQSRPSAFLDGENGFALGGGPGVGGQAGSGPVVQPRCLQQRAQAERPAASSEVFNYWVGLHLAFVSLYKDERGFRSLQVVCVCTCRRPRAPPFPTSPPTALPSWGPGVVSSTAPATGDQGGRQPGISLCGGQKPSSQDVSEREPDGD